ncbi:uncharacterized protein Z520_07292 [Fonsecaea multimorphosa CBS 102226]|uniref:Protein kinase domain-containing protein n=1 Tax=Fonsecaea multimorphosa CBS 102226 TaxID=1442371 RepID=A0A0D2KKL5_9EURO|nr:uncharacterized protein Z520_07292 [Fonsecaea multimorphosa CBS 102226]KIX97178.1 hypothetical protein Z520_07292 [Fonsecaea multimorphosa CBS 102226]OAL22954.1 hypothetical protein AYO22_06862 [Fonsecaea multimorphosa]
MAAPVAADSDLINFDIIETHKENIQSLPGGRSVKQLASILSPLPSSRSLSGACTSPTLEETKTLNDAIRQEYEIELQSIADSDDPLDIYDRYVKWTLNAYPSAQATPQSQLLPLLERATKTFLTSTHYKNDPRYLKLWLHYIRLFSDTPRETFAFLARHGIGEGLGLFYEEFAAWLEAAGRWVQADEVYQLGIEREARPTERLTRKYAQFQRRFDARPQVDDEPSSPALPTVRPALAAKIDPFASAHVGDDPQAARQRNGLGGSSAPASRSGKPKMAIFSDADNAQQQPLPANNTKGWDSIGSVKERKKENTIEARSWAGEKLKAGGRVGSVPKMEIFKDPASRAHGQSKRSSPTQDSLQPHQVVNPRTGRAERVFVALEVIYPADTDLEFSFEELRAMSRGWAQKDWRQREEPTQLKPTAANAATNARSKIIKSREPEDIENLTHSFADKVDLNSGESSTLGVHDVSTQSMVGMPESDPRSASKPPKQKEKKLKIREVKQETQTVKTRLESPTGKKLKRKNGPQEPTMTFHSKAATNEIYDMFNQPLRKSATARDDTQSGDDTDFTEGEVDDGYSTAGDAESTVTGQVSAPGSEFGDYTLASTRQNHSQSQSQSESVSPWSDFTTSKHVPPLDPARVKDKASSGKNHRRVKHKDRLEDMTESMDSSNQDQTQTSGFGAYDTQAIAAIAEGNFDDLDTKAIAMIAGDFDEGAADAGEDEPEQDVTVATSTDQVALTEDKGQQEEANNHAVTNNEALATPTDDEFEHREISHKPRFIPLPPVDYEPTPIRPYRDPAMLAQNKMPFMTPIAERTESSLAPSTVFNVPGYFDSKTPSRSQYESPSKFGMENLLLSSPQQQIATPSSGSGKRKFGETGATEDELITSSPQKKGPSKKTDPNTSPISVSKGNDDVFKTPALPSKPVARSPLTKIHEGPIIADLQCNPCDDAVRNQILGSMSPSLATQKGYYDHSSTTFGRYPALKSYAEKQAKSKAKFSPRKSQNDKVPSKAVPPVLKFGETTRVYAVKRELGEGAFAPVYLVDSYDPAENEEADENDKENKSPPSSQLADTGRQPLEALKTESPPGTLVWEFHIVRLIKQRLGSAARSMQSIILAHECHLYRDEAYLVLSYSPQGTLLDLVNLARAENVKAGKPAEGLDEVLAMWLSVELLRTLEDLHRVGILHGDLKGDNCLVRFDTSLDLTAPFDPEGNYGWQSRGLKLIDFGRGIDTRMFKPKAQFIADWPSCPQDCTEIRECRPWKWQIDYHGAAGVIHSLLFGKYIETVPAGGNAVAGPGQKKEWKLKENLKRYWEKDVWGDVFATLLNPGCVADGEEMPIQGNLKRVRTMMEKWLVDEGERGGRDLRASLRRMERLICVK